MWTTTYVLPVSWRLKKLAALLASLHEARRCPSLCSGRRLWFALTLGETCRFCLQVQSPPNLSGMLKLALQSRLERRHQLTAKTAMADNSLPVKMSELMPQRLPEDRIRLQWNEGTSIYQGFKP